MDAAKEAGMKVVGIGPGERVGHATWRFDDTNGLKLANIVS
ncbi:beta-phosphoglucomutase [Vibrio variabilis]|uniref:Beta-phosphoglucomutase n=1 Tax=Vibrio variabilis TaxID=990271 RepID=A0ABQ0J732_9VIBR|nr:beta-phosphoglucomutase [Vibrio variabilis]